MRRLFVLVSLVGLLASGACGTPGTPSPETAAPVEPVVAQEAPSAAVGLGPAPSRSPSRSPSPSPSRSASPVARKPTSTPAARSSSTAVNEGPKWLTTKVPAGTRQAIVVDGTSMSTTYVKLSAYQRTADGGWRRVFGPVSGRIGSGGFSWNHKEGVPTTPIGVFSLPLAFGWADPGTKLSWRTATTDSVWVDDPESAYYDTWQTAPANGRWTSAEQLHISLYRWAIWINFNPQHTPYAGSAVFLHLLGSGATAGCVSVDQTSLLWLLDWLDPANQPRILIGPESALDQ